MIIDVLILTVTTSQVNEMSESSYLPLQRNILYQVHCGRWQQANVIDHPGKVLDNLLHYNWKQLKETLGVTHIYLLGIWENEGKIVVEEENGVDLRAFPYRTPSPFAITSHVKINHELGSANDMHRLITCLHGLGLQVLVDFVPNHTGLSHPWILDHSDYYKKDTRGQLQTAFSGDVAELNYENPDLRAEMIRVISHIASFGFDGIRCDMAHLVPLSFWSDAVALVKKTFPQFLWLAEAYSNSVLDLRIQSSLMDVGFDAIYDEPLYRNLRTEDSFERISHFMSHFDYVLNTTPQNWIHYLMNHDDNFPLSDREFSVWLRLASLLPGWLLLYNGSLWGRLTRLAHHWIEVLPEVKTVPSELNEEYITWFSWLSNEQPRITTISGNLLKRIGWTGVHSSGVIWFNLTPDSQSTPDVPEDIGPYQVVITTLS